MKKSTPLIAELKAYFRKLGYRFERINSGKIPVGRSSWMHLANEGHPDCVAYLPRSTTLFIEVKMPGDVLSEKQNEYIAYLDKCGYTTLIVEDLAGVQSWLFENGFAQPSSAS